MLGDTHWGDYAHSSHARSLWGLWGAYYTFELAIKSLAAVTHDPLYILRQRVSGLQGFMFRSVGKSWHHAVSGDMVEADDGQWYECFLTNKFDYSALRIEADSAHGTPSIDIGAVRQFEDRLATCLGAEAAALFNSGYVCNVETLRSLAQPDTLFVWDRQSHRSTFEGLKPFRNAPFKHNDMGDLERVLRANAEAKDVWVLVEGCYSMAGDSPSNAALNALKRQYGFRILNDQAHSVGVLGEDGLDGGIDADLRMVAFSKFSGLFGGAIVGSWALVDAARDGAVPEATVYPPYALGALNRAVGAIEDGTVAANAAIVRRRSDWLWLRLQRSGWRTAAPRGSHIIIINVGVVTMACALQQWCLRRGVYFSVVAFPAIPSKIEMGFRLCVNASMTTAQLEQMVTTLDAFAAGNLPAIQPALPPPRPLARQAGMRAVRILGGNDKGYDVLEAEAARRCGYDMCIISNSFAHGVEHWRKQFHRLRGVDDVRCLESEDDLALDRPMVALIPMRPFGCMMLCDRRQWGEGPEMRIRHPAYVFTTSPPPHVYAPDAYHKDS